MPSGSSLSELSGFSVGVTADRRGDEQALMFTRLGVEVVHGPAIRTLPLAEGGRLQAITEELIASPPDYLVANTGLGIRSWLGVAATCGLDAALVAALERHGTRIAARGPKAAGAAQIAGLRIWWRPASEQLAAVGDRLLAEGVAGKKVAVQLHGDGRQELTGRLTAAGAEVVEVPVYRWTPPADAEPALRLIERCCAGGLDAVTFTAGPAVRNLMDLADAAGAREALLEVLNGPTLVACVGPVCASAAIDAGVRSPLVPEHWRLGSLVRLVADALRARRRVYDVEGHTLAMQGAAVVVDGEVSRLTDRERAVLAALSSRGGATVTRAALLGDVWGDASAGGHALEAVVARLRSKLGPAGDAIETVVRRGYRLAADDLTATGGGL